MRVGLFAACLTALTSRAGRRSIMAIATMALAGPVAAQAPAARLIEAGTPVTGSAGNGEQVDIYRFIGSLGSRVSFTLESPSQAVLTLYTPDGEEMLYSSGKGKIELEAVLPLTEPFLVGVSGVDGSRPYKLSFSEAPGDLHQMFFAQGIGYSIARQWDDNPNTYYIESCWIDPGRKWRRTWPRGTEEISLGRDGVEYATLTLNGREPRQMERTVKFEGLTAIYPTRTREGATRYTRVNLKDRREMHGPYNSYLCQ